jgi:Cys-rich four helix bundle protein (predicted Tat secretion target)
MLCIRVSHEPCERDSSISFKGTPGSTEICLAHCITLLGDGEKELAARAKTVEDIIASCTALRQMAAANSPHVAKLAGVVADIRTDCETECRKHEKKQRVCHDCAEACAQCAKECQKAAA